MKRIYALCAILSLSLFSVKIFAQTEELKPGIYTVVGDEYRALKYCSGITCTTGVGIGFFNMSTDSYHFRGTTSGVEASDTFVLVIDPNKKSATITPRRADIFIRTVTPEGMVVFPLSVNQKKNRRILSFRNSIRNNPDFDFYPREYEYKQINDTTFLIHVFDLVPGEYGIAIRLSRMSILDPEQLFCFTIPE